MILKWAKDLNRHIFQRRHTNGQQEDERCSLIIREMQIKTTIRYHLTPVRMAIIKKKKRKRKDNKCWRECGDIRILEM